MRVIRGGGDSEALLESTDPAALPALSLRVRRVAVYRSWMDISLDPSRLNLDLVYEWLRGSYWSPNIRYDVVERAFANSLVAGAYVDSMQVGVARAVTDRATFAWLCDVFVAEPARGRGVATALVRALIDHPELTTLRRWALATRDAHAVYRSFGFAPADPSVWMALSPDPAGWQLKP